MTFHPDPTNGGDTIQGAYKGEGSPLFWLAVRTGFLTLLTLGIYRFWAKTRIRRYMWSATAPGGVPFEYTGKGLEKFLGFLVAMVILAVYLGIMQMVLFAIGLSVFSGGTSEQEIVAQIAATQITLLGLIPLLYIARYRGRRYLLSRTRWRGIRFGADKGAMGYMWRGLGYSLLSAITLGILVPLAMFKLEKYMTDRTWYGDAKFEQGGHWTMLYRSFFHVFIAILVIIAGVVLSIVTATEAFIIIGVGVGYIWLFFGMVYFQVKSFELLTNTKTLGNGVRFTTAPRTGTVIFHFLIGGLVTGILTMIAAIPIGLIVFALIGSTGGFAEIDTLFNGPLGCMVAAVAFVGYLLVFVLAQAFAMVFIAQPIQAHYTNVTQINNAQVLSTVRQREGDSMPDAEGFADALDVGGGF
jgi:uncharacterized membrane protein YjgN (DUF898 family)